MPNIKKNSEIDNQARDEQTNEHAEAYEADAASESTVEKTNVEEADAQQIDQQAPNAPEVNQEMAVIPALANAIKATLVDAPAGGNFPPPVISPSVDRTKQPSASFSNLPIPTYVKEIKIKATRLQNGFNFTLTWDEQALEMLENAVQNLDIGLKPTSHVEKAEMRKKDDDNSRGGGLC